MSGLSEICNTLKDIIPLYGIPFVLWLDNTCMHACF